MGLLRFCLCSVQTISASYSYSGRLKSQKVHMVPENEFHHKEQQARSATPANQQNGPGSTGKPATGMKTEEGTSEDGGEYIERCQGCLKWNLILIVQNSTIMEILLSWM